MDSLFTLIAKNAQFTAVNLQHIEFLVELSLNVLHDLTDDPATSNLCVKILSNTARQCDRFRQLVLTRTFAKLEETTGQKRQQRLENFIQDANLSLLTNLAEFLLPVGDQVCPQLDYLKLTRFWQLIQDGLVHTNSLTRKRALYLLKRITDTASIRHLDVETVLYNSRAACWTDFFLCIEMMEESSVHIIKPCLGIVDQSLVPAVVEEREMHFTWVLVLLSRAFLHESKFIVRWAVRTFLQSDFRPGSAEDYEFMNRFVMGPLMAALQKSFLYHRAEDNLFEENCPRIAVLLTEFFGSYVRSMPDEETRVQYLTGRRLF